MLIFEKSSKNRTMKDPEKCLDSQLWHACAGSMVQMPAINSKVYYFPQGHAEHAQGIVEFPPSQHIAPLILCRVSGVKFMADPETDEVFAKIRMVPLRPNEPDYNEEDSLGLCMSGLDAQEKPASFAKTLTQSDANNGGGFSVPRYCAETIFPRLDYSADPPVQTVFAKDVHGNVWKFRHIYRGTPRRHLLTTGWSTFVNQKKLVAGDSIVFLRAENGDLCVGIRRVKKGGIGGGSEAPGWNPPNGNGVSGYGGFNVFVREEDGKLMRSSSNGGNLSSSCATKGKGKVLADSVMEAATLASKGQPFEVVYYPRASTPEFCVKAAAVKAAMRFQWCPGMRFKMPFETEDSSRISWFMGTISSLNLADPARWPNSPWRLLQVTWDEPELLQNVKRVSPWLVELVSSIPAINLAPFSPPRKKLRCPPHSDFSVEGQFAMPMFQGAPLGPRGSNPFGCFIDGTPASIQGARHAQFGSSLPDLHLSKLQPGLFQAGFHQLDHAVLPARISTGAIVGTNSPTTDNNLSCLLTIGNPSESPKKPSTGKPQQLVLFGKIILTEEQLSSSNSTDTVSPAGNSSSEGNLDKTGILSDASGFAIIQNGVADNSSSEGYRWCREWQETELGFEIGHCKVFMESDDVGRTLDLSVLGSYLELYRRLSEMFGIGKADIIGHVLYKDSKGAVKQIGDESFSDFMKTARRLDILMETGSDNISRNNLLSNVHLNEQVSC